MTFEATVPGHVNVDALGTQGAQERFTLSSHLILTSSSALSEGGLWFLDERPRKSLYRKQNKIPIELGTAVNAQVMVFGNKGETATGAFTRNLQTVPTSATVTS